MNQFWITVGLAIVFVALYQSYKEYKKSTKSSNSVNDLILGIMTLSLLFVAIDNLTVNYLFHQLGKKYYYWLIGGLVDSILIVVEFRKNEKKLTRKEELLNHLRFVYCLVVFSWYFMYYLCK